MSYFSFTFTCLKCNKVFSDLVLGVEGKPDPCPRCRHGEARKHVPMGNVFRKNIPDYPGAHKRMAGYAHIENRPAEKAGRQVAVPRGISTKAKP
jgi:hypothetical protein